MSILKCPICLRGRSANGKPLLPDIAHFGFHSACNSAAGEQQKVTRHNQNNPVVTPNSAAQDPGIGK